MKKKDSKLKRPETAQGGHPKPDSISASVNKNGSEKHSAEISYTRCVVYNPFTKEKVNIKLVETSNDGIQSTAQGWFPIDNNFTVLMELVKNNTSDNWTITGFPKNPIK